MKKVSRLAACLCAVALLLQGCAPPSVSASNPASTSTLAQPESAQLPAVKDDAPASQNKAPAPQNNTSDQPLRVFLPATHEALRGALAAMAKAEGLDIEIQTAPFGPGYAAHLEKNLAGGQPSALFWVESPGAAQPLLQDSALLNLNDEALSPSLRALSQKVPKSVQLTSENSGDKTPSNACYGLPIGYYAEGTIVNIALLAQLLGTGDTTALAQNLTACTWEEWKTLAETLQAYLQKPSRMSIVLAGVSYTTPRFRPEDAQALRGLFALQTQSGGLFTSGLAAAMSAAFPKHKDWNAATPGEIQTKLAPPLAALAEALRLESASMVGPDGPVPRGEDFAATAEISSVNLQQIMGKQMALFTRGDMRTVAQIQQEYPSLINRLALVPTKLPLQDEGKTNTLLQAGSEGYLCIASAAPDKQQAQAAALLVRLFVSPQGIEHITQNMRLVAFSAPYSTNAIEAQLAARIEQGQFYTPPAGQMARQKQLEAIGLWALKNLLTKEEWQDKDIDDFVAASLKEFGVLAQG